MNNEIIKELELLKKQISDFENKYLFSRDSLVVNAILNKLNVDQLVISYKEVEKFKFNNYVACFDEKSKTITIRKFEQNEGNIEKKN